MKNPKWVPNFKWSIGGDIDMGDLPKKLKKFLNKKLKGVLSNEKGTAEEIRIAFSDTDFDEIELAVDNAGEFFESIVGCIEFSIIREDNEHGFKSYGYGGEEKIIAFEDDTEIISKEELLWAVNVVETMAEALNAKGL